jgi:hypothetical protein
MASYYDIPGGLTWCKANLHYIIGNKDLQDIMNFGDLWRSRGHTPLVHVVGPAMDDGAMWDNHEDPSGLLDNIPSHIDMFIVDFYNLETPELPKQWWTNEWLLWEYKSSSVYFNGTHAEFVKTFKVDPETTQDTTTDTTTDDTTDTSTTTTSGAVTVTSGDINIHLVCPHCGEKIF